MSEAIPKPQALQGIGSCAGVVRIKVLGTNGLMLRVKKVSHLPTQKHLLRCKVNRYDTPLNQGLPALMDIGGSTLPASEACTT